MNAPIEEARQGHSRAGIAALVVMVLGVVVSVVGMALGQPMIAASLGVGVLAAIVLAIVGLVQRTRKRLIAALTLLLLWPSSGILAAVAIPAYLKYIRRAKTSEATMSLRKIFDSSVSYYDAELTDSDGKVMPKSFPASTDWTPPLGECCKHPGGKCPPDPALWDTPTWKALNFFIDDPHYYSYRYVSSGTGSDTGVAFTASASGDLNCDGVYSTFERIGSVDAADNISGGGGIYRNLDLE
ncbi:MAG TPA: hypothetical protein VG389_24470 [Myxococcota bacterium]|jgi:type IV pilus assembly protein PilA|nr:hypothetical protein [Myxococcota bacterium]